MITRLRCESGQALAMIVLFASVTLGATAMTLDVGSWYREHRQAQTVADAAALSGADSLPGDTAGAYAAAEKYADDNGGTIDADDGISFPASDTMTVKVTRPTKGFFAPLFDIVAPHVHATATARAVVPQQVFGAAPIAVEKSHPALTGAACPQNKGTPCFDQETTISLGKLGVPGAFDLVNLDLSGNGTTGASTLANWVQNGFSGALPLGTYLSDPGAKWNNNSIDSALQARMASNPVLLFPVYDTLTSNGQNAQYVIVGWAAFYVKSFQAGGSTGSLDGWFKRVIWNGIQSASGPTGPDYGVRSVALVN